MFLGVAYLLLSLVLLAVGSHHGLVVVLVLAWFLGVAYLLLSLVLVV